MASAALPNLAVPHWHYLVASLTALAIVAYVIPAIGWLLATRKGRH